jgi:hypothetical protein
MWGTAAADPNHRIDDLNICLRGRLGGEVGAGSGLALSLSGMDKAGLGSC